MRKREADFLAPTGALYTKNALFFQDVSNFFLKMAWNGLDICISEDLGWIGELLKFEVK